MTEGTSPPTEQEFSAVALVLIIALCIVPLLLLGADLALNLRKADDGHRAHGVKAR